MLSIGSTSIDYTGRDSENAIRNLTRRQIIKFKWDKSLVIKLLTIGLLLLVAPFVVPFTIELILMADILGLEALILFLIYQSRHAFVALRARLLALREHVTATILLLAGLYIFQPKIIFSHTAGSSLILIFACSAVLAATLWLPAFYLSAGGFS